MSNITGNSSAEIDAPIDDVWKLVEDVESAPQWQGGLMSMRVLDRDGEGRAIRCEAENDAKIRTVKSIVLFTYDGPDRLTWTQEKGDLKSVEGSWTLEDLGGDRTRRGAHGKAADQKESERTEVGETHGTPSAGETNAGEAGARLHFIHGPDQCRRGHAVRRAGCAGLDQGVVSLGL